MKLNLLLFTVICLWKPSIANDSKNLSILPNFKFEHFESDELDIDFSAIATLKPNRLPTESDGTVLPPMFDRAALIQYSSSIEIDGGEVRGLMKPIGLVKNPDNEWFVMDLESISDRGNRWHRPVSIYHVVSGTDFGWRRGTGKWPHHFEDTIAPIIELAQVNPIKLLSGTKTNFPPQYQNALYLIEQNCISLILLSQKGSSYSAKKEILFTSDRPISNAVIHSDDLLYAETNSGVYRISYDGDFAKNEPIDSEANKTRQLRRKLESFQAKVDPESVEKAWPHLSSSDRLIRHTARLAIESQPLSTWIDKALAAEKPQTVITSCVAMARSNQSTPVSSLQRQIFDKLIKLNPNELPLDQKLGLIRAYELTFDRLGKPTPIQKARLLAKFDPLLPSKSDDLNHELLKMLVYLKASTSIENGIELIQSASPSESQKISYALLISYLEKGWTMQQRRIHIQFLNQVSSKSNLYTSKIYTQMLAGCSDEERVALSNLTGEFFNPIPEFSVSSPEGPGKNWTITEALSAGQKEHPNYENGRSLFFSTGCASCHRMDGLGGGVGPDLSSIPDKFELDYVLESIMEPDKEISDYYNSSLVNLRDGTIEIGMIIERGDRLEVYSAGSYKKPKIVTLDKVVSIEPMERSQMPSGLLNLLNENEVRDLLGYLMVGGKLETQNKK